MKIGRRLLTIAVIFIIFYFLVRSLLRNWNAIPFDTLHFNPLKLVAAFIMLLVNFVFFVRGWQQTVRTLGGEIAFTRAFWVMAASQTAKYVPGGIWFALGRIQLGKRDDLPAAIIGMSLVVETALTFLVGIVLLMGAVFATRQTTVVNTLLIIIVFVFFLVVLYPPVLRWGINILLRVCKRPAMTVAMTYSSLLRLSTYFFGLWIAQIIGYFFLIGSFHPVDLGMFGQLIVVYILSWMAGFIAIFAPGGLGVREGTMSWLLSAHMPIGLAIAVSFLSRIWITIFEVVVFFIGLLVMRTAKREGL